MLSKLTAHLVPPLDLAISESGTQILPLVSDSFFFITFFQIIIIPVLPGLGSFPKSNPSFSQYWECAELL